jgi:dTDP-4-dehydro-6-deoxy-alpha-D-glucopyranose 2,3-dehydratase
VRITAGWRARPSHRTPGGPPRKEIAMHDAAAPTLLRHADDSLPLRIARSTLASDGGVLSNAQFHQWLDARRRQQVQRVERIPFAAMRSWSFRPGSGNLAHDTGRFFAVEGLRVETDFGPVPAWTQPIISQPEIGILGIVVREFDGVLHCLIQAKTEPGNANGVQLAPTVQATKSNYTGVHRGAAVPYLAHFRDPAPHRVLADVLQSEQGTWFYRKRNRNMVVELDHDIEVRDDFCWLTIGQLHELLLVDNLVAMDTRTVLSCLPYGGGLPDLVPSAELKAAIDRSATGVAGSVHRTSEILSWITARQAEHELRTELMPLREVRDWTRSEMSISHGLGVFFSVIAVDVQANSREVSGWTQPMIEPHGVGINAMLVRRFDGVLHALVNARVEPGFLNVVELAPTVQCTPENYAHLPPASLPPMLDLVLGRRSEQVLFDVELAEEGGRFYHPACRYLIVEVFDEIPIEVRPEFRWMTLHQLSGLLQHSHYLNVQARTLVTCLRALG